MKNDTLDADALAAIMDYPGPESLTAEEGRGTYYCKSVEHAVVPPELIRHAVKSQRTRQDSDGFFYFEAVPEFDNRALCIRPVPKKHFEVDRNTQQSGMKVLARTLDRVDIKSVHYSHIHCYSWPRLMYAWSYYKQSKGEVVYIRAVRTRAEWDLPVSEAERAMIRWSKGWGDVPPSA